jgi:hypothetical protein
VLLEELRECRNGNIESIVAIVLMESGELGRGGYASGLLEVFEKRLWL